MEQVSELDAMIEQTGACLPVVDVERIPCLMAAGRVLAQAIRLDRDSPACDVSAMDGYAIALSYLEKSEAPVSGTNYAGRPSEAWVPGEALRVYTGAPVPPQAECVIRREDTIEEPSRIRFRSLNRPLQNRENIRYRGENGLAGTPILEGGCIIGPAEFATLASFAEQHVAVYRKLRVSLLNTGDELVSAGAPVAAWQIRDSNGPFLRAFLGPLPWIDLVSVEPVADDLAVLTRAVEDRLQQADVVILTGGVSKGDSDFVREAVEKLGGTIAFHGIPIRPGKPMLAATWPNGKLVLGLPGNPLSVAVTAKRMATPLLYRMAGISRPASDGSASIAIDNPDDRTLHLTWFRLVEQVNGRYRLVSSRGSGDVVSLGKSCGFIEVPPQASGAGPWRYYPWQ